MISSPLAQRRHFHHKQHCSHLQEFLGDADCMIGCCKNECCPHFWKGAYCWWKGIPLHTGRRTNNSPRYPWSVVEEISASSGSMTSSCGFLGSATVDERGNKVQSSWAWECQWSKVTLSAVMQVIQMIHKPNEGPRNSLWLSRPLSSPLEAHTMGVRTAWNLFK